MKENDRKVIEKYLTKKVRGKSVIEKLLPVKASSSLLSALSEDISQPGVFNSWLQRECSCKDSSGLGRMLFLGFEFSLFDQESARILSGVALEDWHCEAEDIVSVLEDNPGDFTNDILYRMALERYPRQYYSDDDNGCVTRKCIWALWRRGAADKITELSTSGDIIAEGYAKHQLQKLNM